MIPLKRLYLVAGFDDHDVERKASDLQRKFETGSVRFLARAYPAKPDKRASYLRGLVKSANDVIFGPGTAANFCRRLDQPCALETAKGTATRKTCERTKGGETACARTRPQLLVVVCADQLFGEVFDRLGRGALILRMRGPRLPPIDDVKGEIDRFEPIASEVLATLSRRSKSFYAPLIPDRNFQRLGGHLIASDAQANLAHFASILDHYHTRLYDGDFRNPKKSGIRGAYLLDAHTAFQEDHFHRGLQTIGVQSRQDGFHLLNAYHVYGVKSDPGFHFDVMNATGGRIGHILTDVLTGASDGGGSTHVNVTPCDRLV
jgi:hypothetical protein